MQNEVLHHIAKGSEEVKALLDTLLAHEGCLKNLITNQWANYAISATLKFESERLFRAVQRFFKECTLNQFGNYVVQKCIDKAKPHWLEIFTDAWHCQGLAMEADNTFCKGVKEALQTALIKNKMTTILSQFGDYQ